MSVCTEKKDWVSAAIIYTGASFRLTWIYSSWFGSRIPGQRKKKSEIFKLNYASPYRNRNFAPEITPSVKHHQYRGRSPEFSKNKILSLKTRRPRLQKAMRQGEDGGICWTRVFTAGFSFTLSHLTLFLDTISFSAYFLCLFFWSGVRTKEALIKCLDVNLNLGTVLNLKEKNKKLSKSRFQILSFRTASSFWFIKRTLEGVEKANCKKK